MKRIAIGLASALLACIGLMLFADAEASTETVLHAFCSPDNCPDGANPFAGLVDVNGTLYGTTWRGGNTCEGGMECGGGTVFALNPDGTQTVLYAFCLNVNCADGADPLAGVIDVGGTLYVTTSAGGIYCKGCGTVFALDPDTGFERVLYAFCKLKKCNPGTSSKGAS